MPTAGALWIFASKGSRSPALSLHGRVAGKCSSGSHFQQLVSSSVQRVAATASQRCLKEPGRDLQREEGSASQPWPWPRCCRAGAGKHWCGGIHSSLLCHSVPGSQVPVVVSLAVVTLCSSEHTARAPKGSQSSLQRQGKHQLASSAQHPKTT